MIMLNIGRRNTFKRKKLFSVYHPSPIRMTRGFRLHGRTAVVCMYFLVGLRKTDFRPTQLIGVVSNIADQWSRRRLVDSILAYKDIKSGFKPQA